MAETIANLSNIRRAVLMGVAFIGTAFYASSFAVLPDAPQRVPLAMGIGMAAALSWPVLGVLLRMVALSRGVRLERYFDLCLIAMAFGEAVLGVAGLVNLFCGLSSPASAPARGVHAALLALSNVVMFAVFARGLMRTGSSLGTAALRWLGGLLAPFAIALLVLSGPLGYRL